MLSSLQLECVRMLYEVLLVPVILYGSDTMIGREKESSGIMVVHMGSLRGLLGIRRMDRMPNLQIREVNGVTKGVVKGLTKVFSDCSVILKEWRIIGLRK